MKYLSPDERASFIEEIKKLPIPEWYLCALLLYTGLRISEALGLRIEDMKRALIFKKPKLKVKILKQFKTKYREIPLSQELIDASRIYLQWRNKPAGPLLVSNTRQFQLAQNYACRLVKKVGKIINRPDINCHSLRHTFAIYAIKRGVELRVLQKLLGHTNIGNTGVYIEAQHEDLETAVDKMFDKPILEREYAAATIEDDKPIIPPEIKKKNKRPEHLWVRNIIKKKALMCNPHQIPSNDIDGKDDGHNANS